MEALNEPKQGSVRRSLAISVVENYVMFATSLLSAIILARLLTPEQIGIHSVGTTLVGLAHILRDFGVSQYVVQERELTTDRLRAAFSVALGLGWALAFVLALLSGPAAWFYAEPGVRQVMLVLACTFVLIPFGAVTMAYMRRQLNFVPLFWVKTISALVHTGAAIGLAYLGFGYMSLAWSALIAIATTVLLLMFVRPPELPRWPGLREVRRVIGFGSFASGASIVNEVGAAAPDLIVGKVQSMEAVGMLGRASGFVDLFNRFIGSAIGAVALPYFSAESRRGADLKAIYLRTTGMMTAVSWPFFGFVALMAYPIIQILFGSQWTASVPLARILCIGAAIVGIVGMAHNVFLALGEVRRYAAVQVVIQLLRVAIVFAAAPFGLIAVAVAIAVASLFATVLSFRQLSLILDLRFSELIAGVRRSLLVTLIALAPAAALAFFAGLAPARPWTIGLLGGIGTAVAWLVAVYATKHEIAAEVTLAASKTRDVLLAHRNPA